MSGMCSDNTADGRFQLGDLTYDLPPSLIAQAPLPRRDASRLLVLDRATGKLHDRHVADLPALLNDGDLLVFNDTKVLPAKFSAKRATGGALEGLFLREVDIGRWRVLLGKGRRLRVAETITLSHDHSESVTATLIERLDDGEWLVEIDPKRTAEEVLASVGQAPLPPYIRRDTQNESSREVDRDRYQTVYASRPGAVAAPTAGLHFTGELLAGLKRAGVQSAFVTLHVGVGTFQPIRVDDIAAHRMHAERYSVSSDTASAVARCRKREGRVVAVGTTTVRVLETCVVDSPGERVVSASSDSSDLFIHPPYRFRVVDVLLTNFHLPDSTLLAMVMAFAGVETIRKAYAHAIKQAYRFYSYGDAMLIC